MNSLNSPKENKSKKKLNIWLIVSWDPSTNRLESVIPHMSSLHWTCCKHAATGKWNTQNQWIYQRHDWILQELAKRPSDQYNHTVVGINPHWSIQRVCSLRTGPTLRSGPPRGSVDYYSFEWMCSISLFDCVWMFVCLWCLLGVFVSHICLNCHVWSVHPQCSSCFE